MAVPKKRTSISKKRIRKNIWKKKDIGRLSKPFRWVNLFPLGNQKAFLCDKQISNKNCENLNLRNSKSC